MTARADDPAEVVAQRLPAAHGDVVERLPGRHDWSLSRAFFSCTHQRQTAENSS